MPVVLRKKKDGSFYFDIHYSDPETGEIVRKRPMVGLKADKAGKNEAMIKKEIIPQIEREIALGIYNPAKKAEKMYHFVKEYGSKSFERHQNERKEHVQKKYQQHFKNHILPSFGNLRITNISAIMLLDWQNEKLKHHKASTVRKFRSIFRSILDDAVLEGLIADNPFKKVPRPSDPKIFGMEDDHNVRPFTLDEINNLINKAQGYMKHFIAIMSFSGMRPGEIISLTFDDIDFENKTININKTTINGEVGFVKTPSSQRKIEMLPIVEKHFLLQRELTDGNPYNKVFLNSSGKPFYSHDIIAVNFKKLLDKADKRYLYQLRHSFSSLMISNGEDILWVSRMLGHKNSAITLEIYAKAYSVIQDQNGQKERAKFLNDCL